MKTVVPILMLFQGWAVQAVCQPVRPFYVLRGVGLPRERRGPRRRDSAGRWTNANHRLRCGNLNLLISI